MCFYFIWHGIEVILEGRLFLFHAARAKMVKRAQKDIVFAREITENLQTFYIPGQYDVRLEPHGQIINDRLVLHFHSNEFVMIKH